MYKIYYTNWHGVTNYAQKAIKALWRKLNYDPRTRKWLMRINLTCIFLMLLFVQVALASKAQTLSMNKKNASLIDVLKEIRVKTGYDFILPKDLAKSGNRVTIQVKNAEINIILDLCFDSQPFTYQISNKMIIVSEKEKSFVERIIDRYLSIEVRGIITDDNGRALPGATIKAKISGIQTNSDEDGRFLLEHVEERDSLIISFLGYRTVVVPVLNNVGTIKLSLNVESLLEVEVNTGYQRLLKERAPGSYVQVNQETLSKRPAANLSTALFGLVAGMQGKENADGSVNFLIRGNGSLYADRNPLVVIDGMPASTSDFSNLNPNDVENVTVLKDAAAASIWGARAANGVIVVTTKKAKAGASLHVEGTAFTRVSKHADLNQMLTAANSADHVGYEKMGFQKGWFFLPYTGSFPGDIGKPLTLAQELLYANKAGQLSSSEMNRKLDSLSQINNKTQLQDYLLRRAMLTQYNVNISSSNELSSSYGSLLFEDNKTRFQETGHRRYGINFKNEYKVAKFLRFNFGLYLQYRDQENTGATVQELAQLSPYETLIKPDGSYSTNLNVFNRTVLGMLPLSKFPYADLSYNLLREVRGRAFETKDYSARIQTGLNIKLLDGLDFDTRLQYERQKTDLSSYYSEDSFFARRTVNNLVEYNNTTKTVGRVFLPKGGILQSNNANVTNYVFRNQFNFNRDLGSMHSINAIAGMEISQFRTDTRVNPWLYGYYPEKLQSTVPPYGYGSNVDPFVNLTGRVSNPSGGTTTLGYSLYRYISYYGNAAYTYNRKYTLSGSVRYDASNFITEVPELRWEPLWSVGALWNLKAEEFANNLSWIDRLSFRATYGRNGNVERSTSTSALLNVTTAPDRNTGTITATIADNGNPTLRWEKTTTTNLGLDFALFKGKLNGSVDVYNKIGSDITGLIALPFTTGTGSQRFNNAGITNRGVEVTLGTTFKVPGMPLIFNSSLNYAYNHNKVTNLYYPSMLANAFLGLAGDQVFVEGKPVNPVYSFTYAGMKDGVPQVIGPGGEPVSMNTLDVLVSDMAPEFLNYEGTFTPPHTFGWSNSLRFKNFSISALLVGKAGGVYRNPIFNYGSAFLGSSKTPVNRFVSEVFGGRADIPSFPNQNEINQYLWTSYTEYLSGSVESSSYVECKEVLLDYLLPRSILNKVHFSNFRIYAQARDLGLIWAANKNNYHPDWLPGTDRPITTFTFGLSFNY